MRGKQAFTLLELLVALSITALVMAGVFFSISSWSRAEERAQKIMERQRAQGLILNRLRQTLSTSYVPFAPGREQLAVFEGMDLTRPKEPFDALTFASLAHRSYRIDAKESELEEMTFFTKPDPAREDGESCRLLYLREGGSIDENFEVEGGRVYLLSDQVSKFELFYLSGEGEFVPEWRLAERNFLLPCAVVVKLGLGCGDQVQEWCIFIPLYLTNNSGCAFESGTLEGACGELLPQE